jgi:hypothetical protein
VNDTWIDLGTEAKLGNSNLEWLVVAACGPLQGTTWPNSWAMTATAIQPSDVIFGYAGVWGYSGYWTLPNWDDYFWGMGPTGPDTQNLYGTWKVTSYC